MDLRKRKRGIRASREKLEAALINSGFHSQAALANQMAIDEGLEKAPKDLVNKVFREQAVSTHNLARIAKALDVEAHTIYLAKDDNEFAEITESQNTGVSTKKNQLAYLFASSSILKILSLVSLVALCILFYYIMTMEKESAPISTKIDAPLGKVRLVMQTTVNPASSTFAKMLVGQLNNQDGFSAIKAFAAEDQKLNYLQAIERWQAHAQ